MRTVALAPEVLERAVEAHLVHVATVRRCETRQAVLDLILSHQVDAAVFAIFDRTDAIAVPFIDKAREKNSHVRLIVQMPPTLAAFQQGPEVVKAGASEVAVQGYDRLGEVVQTVLAPDWQPGAASALLEVVLPRVPKDLEPFAVACALKGSPRLTAELVAGWVGASARTIRSRLGRASLSPPLAFVKYCSAAHAMCLLYQQGLAPGRVVERMRFGSRRALHDLIQEYSDYETNPVRKRWAYVAFLLRAGEFLCLSAERPAADVKSDLEQQLERYANGDMTAEERVDFEQRIIVPALTEAGEALDRIRDWSKVRHLEPDLRQRKDETWIRLLRSIGRGGGRDS